MVIAIKRFKVILHSSQAFHHRLIIAMLQKSLENALQLSELFPFGKFPQLIIREFRPFRQI